MSESLPGISIDLVLEARSGSRNALRTLVEQPYPTLRRWALVQTGDPTEADDLTQDVLIQMIQKLHSFNADARFESWLFSMTRNAATDRFRVERRSSRITDDPRAFADNGASHAAGPVTHDRGSRNQSAARRLLFGTSGPTEASLRSGRVAGLLGGGRG